ncbi:SpoIIAA-like [Maribacter dokdonensis]|uniref:DUF7793 family protein n=1 Tax=Maribacter dokdonensis TaxID=320912 RepID=UPI001B1DAAE4|nr:hypothetical protein [Maribacter dokdonensis]CAG2532837.1 SpoIIAA-like [Maribacter dokdonensis]
MKKHHENKFAVYLLTKDLIHIIYTVRSLDLNAAQIIVRDRMMMQEGVAMPVLCDIRELRMVNKQARDFFAMEGSLLIKALAFLIAPPVTDVLSEFYLNTHKSDIPSKSFTLKSEALNFLKRTVSILILGWVLPLLNY